ncbi:MAG: Serine/threonine kinase [uncultured Sulfurovum sp.]|uniref:Serine/threonine kinase n=1 Tax=uncultured Sulfurovum sp. TaxID=269237 RepID=A0A6S6T4P3_9BACT|nr:MAG: Serine/threonine kinase [uncultured Sulfurovum sp.]
MYRNIVHIESLDKNNRSFGTGFVIDNDDKGVYILTCKHVIDDVVNPMVEEVKARIIAIGNEIDMAVIYVSKLNLKPLILQVNNCHSSDVEIIGFSNFNQNMTQKKHISAILYNEKIELHTNKNDFFYYIRKIKTHNGYTFDRGNSGAPVFCKKTNKVIAMISNKEGTEIGYAIEINSLKQIWKEVPTYILEQDTLSIESISGIHHDQEINNSNKEIKNTFSPFHYIIIAILILFMVILTYFMSLEKSLHEETLVTTTTKTKITPQLNLEHDFIPTKVASHNNPTNHQCIDIDPHSLTVHKEDNQFKIFSHNTLLFNFIHDKGAHRAQHIMKKYNMTQSCSLGKHEKAFSYLLTEHGMPMGTIENEECIGFSYHNLNIEYINNHYDILSEGYQLFHFAYKNEAEKALSLIKEHQFNHFCYIRNPKSDFKYFKP